MLQGLLLLPLILGGEVSCASAGLLPGPGRAGQERENGYGVIDDRPRRAKQGAPRIPKNDGWVTDIAGMLTKGEERELEALMESYKQGTTHEIALLTVPSLKGRTIEEFALEVDREWGVGGEKTNNGALLVVSKEDRLVRIDVGRGLEGSLTDAVSGRIIRNVIVPAFKRGRFAEGLKQGVVAIHEAIGGKYASIPRDAAPVAVGLAGLVPFLFLALIFLLVFSKIGRWGGFGGARRRGFWGSGWGPGGGLGGGGGFFGGGFGGGGLGGGGFSGFGGGGGFSGGGATGRW